MIPPHLFYQIYLYFLEQNDCTPPKCGELSEYTDSTHTKDVVCAVLSEIVQIKDPMLLIEKNSL